MYADNIALMTAAHSFEHAESILTDDMEMVQKYLRSWRLKLSTNKTVSSVFYLKSHFANFQPKVYLENRQLIRSEINLKYLGVLLDRTLSFKHNIDQLKSKVTSRVSLIKS